MDATDPTALRTALGGRPTVASRLVEQVSSVVLGAHDAITLATSGFLAGGHVLIEDVPGVGKTLLAKAFARSIGGTFGRIQGTPDLMPTDVTGVEVYDPGTGSWSFRAGPIFNNVVLLDEVNRATPRTQSALLECMGEGQVTADGSSRPLPTPFLVLATQNPRSDAGTFSLLRAQRDRFALVIALGLLGRDDERSLLCGAGGHQHLDDLAPVASPSQWTDEMRAVDLVEVKGPVVEYILDLCAAVRRVSAPDLSPRAALTLKRVASAHAVLDGRAYLSPDDVKAVAPSVLAHRLSTGEEAGLGAGFATVTNLLADLAVPVPG